MAESDGTLGPGFGSEPALGGSALRPVAVALLETAGHLASPPPPSRPSLPLVEGNLAGPPLACADVLACGAARGRRARARVTLLGSWESGVAGVRLRLQHARAASFGRKRSHAPPASAQSKGLPLMHKRSSASLLCGEDAASKSQLPLLFSILTSVQPKGNEGTGNDGAE